MKNEETFYKIMAYVKEFSSERAVEVYCGKDREIAMEYVRGYSRSGTYVHLIESKGEGDGCK